jgi:predicted enzyme related to lactoylglutathione lyase
LAESVNIGRSNTILYCSEWASTVAFYRDVIALETTHEAEWFVEFALHDAAHLSIADTARTSIDPAGGAGITLSWQVDDLAAECARLAAHNVATSDPMQQWGGRSVFLHDPEGNRLELWENEG